MNKTPLQHPVTAEHLAALAAAPPHAMIFVGKRGIGKQHLAEWWATRTFALSPSQVWWITPEKNTISVAQIRELYALTKTVSSAPRVVVVAEAQTMSDAAQNAFLKLLEEPNDTTYFILLVSSTDALLPTITSRAQVVPVLPIPRDAFSQFLTSAFTGISAEELQQIAFVGAGLPGMTYELATDDSKRKAYQERARAAKTLLAGSPYDKLVTSAGLTSREQTIAVLEIAVRMAQILMSKASAEELQSRVTRLARIEEILQRIVDNGNIKANLTLLAIED